MKTIVGITAALALALPGVAQAQDPDPFIKPPWIEKYCSPFPYPPYYPRIYPLDYLRQLCKAEWIVPPSVP